MYAIIQTGSKQYRVRKGDVLDVELLHPESEGPISLGQVLLVKTEEKTTVGAPFVKGSEVLAEIIDEAKGPKVVAFKYKKRKQWRRKVGHRQHYSRVKILDIKVG